MQQAKQSMMLDIRVLQLPSHQCTTSNSDGGDYCNSLRVLAGILFVKTSRLLSFFLSFFLMVFFYLHFLVLCIDM